jgi:hypothetical protein
LFKTNRYRHRVPDVFAAISPNRRTRGSVRNRENRTEKGRGLRNRPHKKLKKQRNEKRLKWFYILQFYSKCK